MIRNFAISFLICLLSAVVFSQPPQPAEIQAAGKLIQEKKYSEAETILSDFVSKNPKNGRGWYLLASARHYKGNYQGAIDALEKSLAINQSWPAMYNMAAALARMGSNKKAFEWLEKSLNAGGAFVANLDADDDFAGLRSETDYKRMGEVIDRRKNPCKYSEKAREFDFWLGDWDVFVNGRKVGENLIERGVNHCILVENWKNTTGGTGKSINVYDASVDKWKQFYVGSQGSVFLFEGNREGNKMLFKAVTVDQQGSKTHHDFQFHKLDDGTVRQKWDTSTDGGKTYTTIWDSIYKRKESGVGSGESEKQAPKEVSFESKDGVKLFGDVYESHNGKSAPLVLLFHQGGGDVRGEYATHIPKLLEKGYNVIAVDLRTGGDRFGSVNRTVAKLGDKKYGYCDAYPDLEASLQFARKQGFTGKTAAWGSSFSAALVFQLAANHGDKLAGILAFSPASGGPMAACKPDLYTPNVKIPVLALRPGREINENTTAQLKRFRDQGFETYVAQNGVHGSSMLNSERVKGDVSDHWMVVLTFLEKAFKAG
ncbi:MAG: hypothetical protein HKN33_12030 [Pyrinomonadaceae bacterium]|nr:hypothetical protein [Pyrinomonadaceae bacterium]